MALHATAAIVCSELRNPCVASGEASRFVRIADAFKSTWQRARPRIDHSYKITSSKALG